MSTPLAVCEQRDVKGLYQKARSGLIPNMTGLNSPYEVSAQPDIELNCSTLPVDFAINKILAVVLPNA